jgi:1-acyl-sn-glycerol-3-phosphate acyltransferase
MTRLLETAAAQAPDKPPAAPAHGDAAPGASLAESRSARIALALARTAGELRNVERLVDPRAQARSRAAVLARAAAALVRIHDLQLEVTGSFPACAALLVANHPSHLDPAVVASLRTCLPSGLREGASWPLFGAAGRSGGTNPSDRPTRPSEQARPVQALAALLRFGVCALDFPEGAQAAGDRTMPFRFTGFEAARLARVPVVPIGIRYVATARADRPQPSFGQQRLRLARDEGATVQVRIGAPLLPHSDGQTLATASRAAVERLLRESWEAAWS